MNYTIKAENFTGDTLTILEGKALELRPPQHIVIVGDIKTISSFLSVRNDNSEGLQDVNISKAIVIVNKKDLTIELHLDPEDYYGAKIIGKLEKTDEILQFHINQAKYFTKEELVKLIKFNKLYFDNAARHAEMLLAFQKVSSTVNIRANDSSDDRGNKERAFVKDVTSNAPTEFILNIPIFKGFPPVRFRVEVCLDVTEGSARFWFESIELHEILIHQVNEIFDEELKSCEGFVIVNK